MAVLGLGRLKGASQHLIESVTLGPLFRIIFQHLNRGSHMDIF
uniref:Uncharacterized protein n=1 Tax=Utricularia reniformis TaxID=192314 RepID=A0A1Y0AZW7_9LAMI|nr:hypothetical protein AEK19_MT0419 [Utricularia reniformis]ART30683.1 hypothetical protein AEK19_MT0419 [Utricularia reniformis]